MESLTLRSTTFLAAGRTLCTTRFEQETAWAKGYGVKSYRMWHIHPVQRTSQLALAVNKPELQKVNLDAEDIIPAKKKDNRNIVMLMLCRQAQAAAFKASRMYARAT